MLEPLQVELTSIEPRHAAGFLLQVLLHRFHIWVVRYWSISYAREAYYRSDVQMKSKMRTNLSSFLV